MKFSRYNLSKNLINRGGPLAFVVIFLVMVGVLLTNQTGLVGFLTVLG